MKAIRITSLIILMVIAAAAIASEPYFLRPPLILEVQPGSLLF